MKTAMVFGTFDVLHLGHIDLLQQAKALVERLIVVVATDANAQKVKGQAPVHTQNERRALIAHIDLIDEAVIGDSADVYKVVRELQPDIICLGYDQEAYVEKLQEMIANESLQIEVKRMTAYKPEQHKSGLIKSYISNMV